MAGQGAAYALKDRMMDQSDKYSCFVCRVCGLIAQFDKYIGSAKCKPCDTNDVVRIAMPYATKLLYQELIAVNIVPRILFDERDGSVKLDL